MPRGTHGHASRFAITVGEVLREDGQSRRVDVYAADRWLTCADNNVYAPSFPLASQEFRVFIFFLLETRTELCKLLHSLLFS